MNAQRLLRLADLLEADAANPNGVRFDLHIWAMKVGLDTDKSPPKTLAADCGTAACAIGLACLSGIFKDDGLTWKPMTRENNIVPIFEGHYAHDAIEMLLEINYAAFGFLFYPSRYPSEHQEGAKAEVAVAQRIRDFVAGKAAP